MKAKTQKLSRLFTIIGIILIVVGVLTASLNQTAGRTINIKTVSIVSDEGNIIQAIMYLPKSATKETPAPGVLAVHGGNSSRYAMSNISQEFARRGYVVMSIDQSFNGQSDRGTNDHQGAEAVMKYMTTLEFVDQSIGVPTVKELIAILQKLPEDYRVYCCGGENYLYLWANKKSITIDCERYLG